MALLPEITGLYKPNKNQTGIFKLTNLQESKFRDLLEFLECSAVAGKTKILYRGENLGNLQNKLGGDANTPNGLSDIYKKCFFLGDKAKGFLLAGKCAKPLYNWDFNIGSASDEDFEYIFSEISKLVTDRKASIFSLIEDEFYNFFINSGNLELFLETVKVVSDDRERLLLRDYYLWILHNLGADSFKYSSYFVSSTTNLNTALASAYMNGVDAKPILFVCFLPSPTQYFGLTLEDINILSTKTLDLGLPCYTNSIYEENETSLKGALFPHFILGIHEFETGRFIVNKHVFEDDNRSLSSVLRYGLTIDQQNFDNFISETNLKGGVITNHIGRFDAAGKRAGEG